MTRLNLLPWRDLRRQELDRQVRNFAIGVAIVMAGVVFWAYTFMNGKIEYQQKRNAYLQTEIKKLDKQLKEVKNIRRKRAALIARMEVIQRLQADRTRMVKIFDALARNLPSGMYLNLFRVRGRNILMKGTADSNGTVSKFMRLIEQSDMFTTPDLHVINVRNSGGLRVSNFTINVRMKAEKKDNNASGKAPTNNKGGKKK